MKTLDALIILNDLSASQRGVFTSAQASTAGVDRLSLSRLESKGQIERILHGVYRACAVPSFREEEVWAAWLTLNPQIPAWNRTRDGSEGAASHGTAAWLLGLGELNPSPITFTTPTRKQTKRQSIRLVKGPIPPGEVTSVAGIPTTTPARTVLDLLDDGEDMSLVASVLKDASKIDKETLEAAFAAKVDALGARYGLPSRQSLYRRLAEEQP